MKRVVVTGGGGFVGSNIVRALLGQGDLVTVVGRSGYPMLEAMGARCLQGDIADQSFMDQACQGVDLVFHVAAKAGIWGTWQEYAHTNITGTAVCIKSCRKNKVPALVYTSTPSVVFDRHDLEGVNEQTPYATKTLCHYATSKIIAEKLILQANDHQLRTTAIRPHLVWGPGDPHLVPRLLERGRNRQLKIIGTGSNRVDVAYIDNVVHAHLLAAVNLLGTGTGAGQSFFIGDQQPVVLWDWVNALFAECAIKPLCSKVPFPVAYLLGALLEIVHTCLNLPAEPRMTRFVALQLARSHWFSHHAARDILGYHPVVTPTEGMTKLLASFSD